MEWDLAAGICTAQYHPVSNCSVSQLHGMVVTCPGLLGGCRRELLHAALGTVAWRRLGDHEMPLQALGSHKTHL